MVSFGVVNIVLLNKLVLFLGAVYLRVMSKQKTPEVTPVSTPESPLRKLREESGLSLRFLAERVGLSYGAIQMVEIGRRSLTTSLAKKLGICLGCDWKALLQGQVLDLAGNPYTRESYNSWKSAKVDDGEFEHAIELMCLFAKKLLQAAAIDSSGNAHPDRFREVVASMSQSMEDIISEKNLLDSLNAKLSTERINTTRQIAKLGDLRKKFSHIKEWNEWDSKKWSDELEVEFNRSEFILWNPIYAPFPWVQKERPDHSGILSRYRVEIVLRSDSFGGKEHGISWTEFLSGARTWDNAMRVYWHPGIEGSPVYFPNLDESKQGIAFS